MAIRNTVKIRTRVIGDHLISIARTQPTAIAGPYGKPIVLTGRFDIGLGLPGAGRTVERSNETCAAAGRGATR